MSKNRFARVTLPVPMTALSAKEELITPDMARKYLESNTSNRHIRKTRVTSYAREMMEGRWQLNGETIIFSKTGKLQNGQHRMLAVIEANTPVSFLVVRGVEDAAYCTMDSGVNRTMGDVLSTYGVSNYNQAAAMLRLAVNYREGLSLNKAHPNSDLETEYLKFPALTKLASDYGAFTNTTRSTVATTVCVIAKLFNITDQGHKVDEFVDGIVTGAGLGIDDPRLILKRKIENLFRDPKSRPEAPVIWFFTVKALSAYLAGKKMTRLSLDRNYLGSEAENLFIEIPQAPRSVVKANWN